MNKKQRELALKELTKKANADFFKEILNEETGDANDLATGEDAELKELVKKILQQTEIHLPGEE